MEVTIRDQIYQKNRDRLNNFCLRVAPVTVWSSDGPTDDVKELYPYFLLDLLCAWQRSGLCGAREVLDEAARIVASRGECIFHCDHSSSWTYPKGVREIRVDEDYTLRQGYERHYRIGRFEVNGQIATEVVWHRHDGYGRPGGLIEFIAYR
jgi:hypothetical protein